MNSLSGQFKFLLFFFLLIISGIQFTEQNILHTTSDVHEAENFIAHGGDVNAKDDYYRTPLHTTPSLEIAQLLIAKGADIKAKDIGSNTLLHTTQSPEVAQLFIAKGADVNAQNIFGDTPLHCTNSPEIAETLIKNGAYLEAKNINGFTPLHKTESPKIAKILIKNRADDVNAQDNYGNTPLHTTKSPEIAKILIENGADVNAQDNYGNTPLHRTQSSEVIKILIENGANLNAQDKYGNTPLMMRNHYHDSLVNNSNIVSELILAGAKFPKNLKPSLANDPVIQKSRRFVSNLSDAGAKRFYLPQSLSDKTLKHHYENYLNGDAQGLESILLDPGYPSQFKNYFKSDFIAEVQKNRARREAIEKQDLIKEQPSPRGTQREYAL